MHQPVIVSPSGRPFPLAPRPRRARSFDLMSLVGIAAARLTLSIDRRDQRLRIDPIGGLLSVSSALPDLVELIAGAIREATALSLSGETIRVAATEDDGDAVLTVIGVNRLPIPAAWMRIDPRLETAARAIGADIELFWEPGEGPTVVVRLPLAGRPVL